MAVSYLTLYLPGSSVGIQVWEGSQLHLILVSQGANSVPPAPGETVRQDPFPQYIDADELAAALAGVGGVGGTVDSVNGQTGTVVLGAADLADFDTASVAAVENAPAVAPTGAWDFVQTPTVNGAPVAAAPTWATMPAGSVATVRQNPDGTWPTRLTSRTDVQQRWTKIVAGSADPPAAAPPSLAGAYQYDVVEGV